VIAVYYTNELTAHQSSSLVLQRSQVFAINIKINKKAVIITTAILPMTEVELPPETSRQLCNVLQTTDTVQRNTYLIKPSMMFCRDVEVLSNVARWRNVLFYKRYYH
jgi:hypothetical protein